MPTTIEKQKSKTVGSKFLIGTKQRRKAQTIGGSSVAKNFGLHKNIKAVKHQTWTFKMPAGVHISETKQHEVNVKNVTAKSITKAGKIRAQIAKLEKQLGALNVTVAPRVILPELHDAGTGRIDAQKVADFIGVPLKQLSEGLGLNYKAVHRSPSANSFQQALRPVKRSLELLHKFFGPVEAIRAWLNTPHPDLDGTSALETILEGKADAVGLLLENAWNGIPV